MVVDVEKLLIDLNFFAGDLNMRNMTLGRAKTHVQVDKLFDVPKNLKFYSFPTITWLKTQRIKVRNVLKELESVAIDSYDAEIYNTGEELLERLAQVTKPYTQSYVAFQLLVNKSQYTRPGYETPAGVLLKLAEGVYMLPEAIEVFYGYLDGLERRKVDPIPEHIKELREELEQLDILSGLD